VGAGPPLKLPADLAVDLPGKRAYVCADALFAVDLVSGDRTLVSTADKYATPEGTLRGSGPAMTSPFACALDLTQGRMFVADGQHKTVLAVDLESGDRTIVSTHADEAGVQHGAGHELALPMGLRLDAGGEALWLVDSVLSTVVRVDIASGDRSIRADGGVGPGLRLPEPIAVALDAGRSRALVIDEKVAGIVQVDLATGARSLLPGEGASTSRAYDLVIDRESRYAFVSDKDSGIVRIDLATGLRTLVSDQKDTTLGPALGSLPRITLDEPRQLLLVSSALRLLSVDLVTGERKLLSDATHGAGPLFESTHGLAYDQASQSVLLVDANAHALLRVDVVDGTRTVLSGEDPAGVVHGQGVPLATPVDVTFDANTQIAYLVDRKNQSIVAVDVATGDRTPVSTKEGGVTRRGNGIGLLQPEGVTLDEQGHLLVVDSSMDALLSVDIATGDRTIVSRVTF
jgi:DNA-binding beta-propeller fold protein YncE